MPIITVDPTGEEIYLPDGQTVLGGLYAAGYAYTVGCRRGGCGICKVDLVAGTVTYDHPVAATVLPAEEKQAGVCLTCRAVPETDLTISFHEASFRLVQPLLRTINDSTRRRLASSASQPKE